MFFYDKGEWLYNRYQQLITELYKRNYSIDPKSRVVKWQHFEDNGLYNTWKPDSQAHKINVERLLERVNQKLTWYRWKGTPIDEYYTTMLKEMFL